MRLIDADWLLSFIRLDEKVIAPEQHTAQDIIMMIQTAPTIEPPPSDPLTLEELREVDGVPVWIVEFPDWGHWELSQDAEDYVQDRDTDFYGVKYDDPCGKFGLHVLGWLAYRRRPEEVTT